MLPLFVDQRLSELKQVCTQRSKFRWLHQGHARQRTIAANLELHSVANAAWWIRTRVVTFVKHSFEITEVWVASSWAERNFYNAVLVRRNNKMARFNGESRLSWRTFASQFRLLWTHLDGNFTLNLGRVQDSNPCSTLSTEWHVAKRELPSFDCKRWFKRRRIESVGNRMFAEDCMEIICDNGRPASFNHQVVLEATRDISFITLLHINVQLLLVPTNILSVGDFNKNLFTCTWMQFAPTAGDCKASNLELGI
jgi:hypothetical protein